MGIGNSAVSINEAIKTRETASSFARQLIKHSFVTERDDGVNSLLPVWWLLRY